MSTDHERYQAALRRIEELSFDLIAAERRLHEMSGRVVETGVILEKLPVETVEHLRRVRRIDFDETCLSCHRWIGFPARSDCRSPAHQTRA